MAIPTPLPESGPVRYSPTLWMGQNLRTVVATTSWLYAATAVSYLFQAITTPFLTRVLSARAFGTMAATQSVGAVLALGVDLGYSISAAKHAAVYKYDRNNLGRLLSEVTIGKCLLCLVGAGAVWGLSHIHAGHAPTDRLFWIGIGGQVIQSFSLVWLFLGIDRIGIAAISNVIAKIVFALAIFITVRNDSGVETVFWLQLITGLAAVIFQYIACAAFVHPVTPTCLSVVSSMKRSWTACWLRSGFSLYFGGNAYILSLFAPLQAVGYYAASERLVRAAAGILSPINTAMLPQVSRLVGKDRNCADAMARAGVMVGLMVGILLAGIIYIESVPLTRTLLGAGFTGAAPSLRILSIALPVIGIGQAVLWQWLVPRGLTVEPHSTLLGLGGQALNVGLAFLLARHYGQPAIAWAIVLSEFFILGGCAFLVRNGLRIAGRAQAASND
jgi:PST family polysaccharide transporter